MLKKHSRTGVTPAILLQHMRGMEQRLSRNIEDTKTELKGDITRIETKMDRMHVNLSGQIGALDERLDSVEIEFLPKRVAKLEKVVGMR